MPYKRSILILKGLVELISAGKIGTFENRRFNSLSGKGLW